MADKKAKLGFAEATKKYGQVFVIWWTLLEFSIVGVMVALLQFEIIPYDAACVAELCGLPYDLKNAEAWKFPLGLPWELSPRFVTNFALCWGAVEMATPLLLPGTLATLPFFLRLIGKAPKV